MSQRLKNILAIANLAPGASIAIPHGLVTSVGRPLGPDIIFLPTADLEVTLTTTTAVTFKNNSGADLSANVLVEAWHTIERSFSDVNDEDLPVKPYIVVGTTALDGCCHLVYRPGATGADAPGGNVFTDWSLLMAALDATSKRGIRTIEFDSRYDPSGAAVIPAGGPWNITNTCWISSAELPTNVYLADGVKFVVDPPGPNGNYNLVQFHGPIMRITNGRTTSPVAPFTDISITATGQSVRFSQDTTLGGAVLPMFAVTPAMGEIILLFNSPRGGLFNNFPAENFVPPGPPMIDSGTDIVTIRAQAGLFENDIVTGSGFLTITTQTLSAWGDIFNEFSNPNFTGVLDQFGVGVQIVRSNLYTVPGVDPDLGPVTADWGPYDATYNETVLVDTSAGDVTINLPNANTQGVQGGERVTVKMINDPGEGEEIIIASTYGNTIENPSISNGHGSKTWEMDSVGNWWLTAVV